jgi:hypothetical protein
MIYAIEMASGGMIDIQSFMMIVLVNPHVIVGLLSQQFEWLQLQCWYY